MTTVTINRADVLRAISQRLEQTRKRNSYAKWTLAALIAAAAVGAAGAKYTSASPAPAPVAETAVNSNPLVSVAHPFKPEKQLELQLPAEALPYQTTTLYARIRGYLRAWKVDRGTRVKTGQVLAEIDTPDFDQQLLQAEADLKQGIAQYEQSKTERDQAQANVGNAKAQVERSEASLKLAQLTASRYKNLVQLNAASQQQFDETLTAVDTTKATLDAAKADVLSKQAAVATSESAINTAEARVNSLRANLHRLKETETFKTIVAPFDGTITRRMVDVGALIPDDGSKPLFTIIQDNVLRIQVDVPQTYALELREGNTARVTLRELPNHDFPAIITRTAHAIDPASRTLAVELELDNRDEQLISGSFVQVKFQLSSSAQPFSIPTSTLKLTKEGPKVALVGADQRIHFQTITLGRDHGATIEVLSGLLGSEALIINPSEGLTEGATVDTLSDKKQIVSK